jgi:hypothetical protein
MGYSCRPQSMECKDPVALRKCYTSRCSWCQVVLKVGLQHPPASLEYLDEALPQLIAPLRSTVLHGIGFLEDNSHAVSANTKWS